MNNVADIMKALQKTTKCITKHCKLQKDELAKQQNKYMDDLIKIGSDKGTTNSEKKKKLKNTTLKLYKCNERMKLIDCQLKNCYKETDKLVKKTIHHALHNDALAPSVKRYAKKYQKTFKNKITAKTLNQYDIDGLKMVGLL